MYCSDCDRLHGAIITASQYAGSDTNTNRIADAREELLKHRLSAHGHGSLQCLTGEKKRLEYTIAMTVYVGLLNAGIEGEEINTASSKLLETEQSVADHYKTCKCPESSPFYSPAIMDI